MFIHDKNPMQLGIRVKQSEEQNKTTTFVKCTRIQPVSVDLPLEYNNPIICSAKEFQKMSKNLAAVGKVIQVESKKYWIKFSADGGELYSRSVSIGDESDDEDEDGDKENIQDEHESDTYLHTFSTDQITQLTKAAGLSNNLQVYPTNGQPLKIKLCVGSLGYLSIFIKSKEQIDESNRESDSNEPDYEDYHLNLE